MLVVKQGPGREQGARYGTNSSDLSVALLLSASESNAAPSTPISLCLRLQRGKEGQGCLWRDGTDRAAGTEQGARDLLERCQQAQCIRKPVTIPPAFELPKHNCFGIHLCATPMLLGTSAS